MSVAPFPYLQELLFIGCTSSFVGKASLFNTFLYNMVILMSSEWCEWTYWTLWLWSGLCDRLYCSCWRPAVCSPMRGSLSLSCEFWRPNHPLAAGVLLSLELPSGKVQDLLDIEMSGVVMLILIWKKSWGRQALISKTQAGLLCFRFINFNRFTS